MVLSPEVINGLFAVGGAFLGAIITGLFALHISRTSKEKREVVVSTSNPSRLLVVHDQIASDVEILVSGKKVDNVVLSEVFLSNTGNKAVENLHFPMSCQEGTQIIAVDALDQETDAPLPGSVVTLQGDQEVEVAIDYINPGEEISLRCIVSGEAPVWSIDLRQPDLRVVHRDQPVASYSDVVSEIVFESLANLPMVSAYLRITSPVFKKFLDRRMGK
ncbi:hypothetical protein [Pacificispira sp.]|uniref:hypothetical protein n=1 Tax=Pacificispira sp. TaxID=2888761 RepID=UPI003B52B333